MGGSDSSNGFSDSEAEATLDEWGWDPFVDEFLEGLVAEAPRRGASVDFEWVSARFLETFDPSEDQAAAAFERFCPEALQERWLYLQSLEPPSAAAKATPDGERAPCSGAAGVVLGPGGHACNVAAPPGPPSGQLQAGCSGSAEAVAAPGPVPAVSGCHEPAVPTGRDRVLVAMQSFLFGLPRPEQSPPEALPCCAQPSTTASGRNAGTSTAGCGGAGSAATVAAPTAATSPAAKPPLCGAGSNEALRKCLEELRWHGEALRRCAAGEDATRLCGEAAERRRALLRGLGLGSRSAAAAAAAEAAEAGGSARGGQDSQDCQDRQSRPGWPDGR